MTEFEREVLIWASATFPDSRPDSLLQHMREELAELADAVDVDNVGGVEAEIGDLGLMLIHLSAMYSRSFESLMREKFATASKRRYEYRPDLGYAKHVEEVEA